jgi:hypothetical protein
LAQSPHVRRALVVVLDILIAGLTVLSAAAIHTGGFVVRLSGIRISARTPLHVLAWLGVVVVLRLIGGRGVGVLGISRVRWSRARSWIRAEPFLVHPSQGQWQSAAFASLGMAMALAILLHEQVLQPYGVADLGDPLFSMWRMGWVTHQIVTDPLHLFDANIFYPERLTLTLSDPMILPALTAAPLLGFRVHPVIAYNLLLFSGFWFSGIATYLLVERLTGSRRAAFVSGLMYACYSYRFEHYGHVELQMTQWMPLILLALHLFVATGRWRYATAVGLLGVAQLYSSMYYAVFFLLFAMPIGIGLLLVYRPPLRRVVLRLGAAAVMASLLAAPLARAFAAAQPMKGERGVDEVTYFSARPTDYLRWQSHSAIWRKWMLPPEPEKALFPGAAPLALAAIALAPPIGAMRLVYTAGLLTAFDGSLGLNGVIYPYMYRWLGPVRGMRVPARFAAIVGLALAILAGFGARRAMQWRRSRWWARAMFAGLIAFIMIDAWQALMLSPVWKEPPSIYQRLKFTPGPIISEFPMAEPTHIDRNTVFLYFSLWHWSRMVNGYSGFTPPSYADLYEEVVNFPRDEAVAALRARGVSHVTVNCGLNEARCDDLLDQMRQSTQLRMVADANWMGHQVQLYEVLAH